MGADLLMRRNVGIRVLYVMPEETGNQWRDCGMGLMWTVREVFEISIAAEFWSFWRRDSSFCVRFTRTDLQLSIRNVIKAWINVSVRVGVIYLDIDLILRS